LGIGALRGAVREVCSTSTRTRIARIALGSIANLVAGSAIIVIRYQIGALRRAVRMARDANTLTRTAAIKALGGIAGRGTGTAMKRAGLQINATSGAVGQWGVTALTAHTFAAKLLALARLIAGAAVFNIALQINAGVVALRQAGAAFTDPRRAFLVFRGIAGLVTFPTMGVARQVIHTGAAAGGESGVAVVNALAGFAGL
jgi:hypothetical protein